MAKAQDRTSFSPEASRLPWQNKTIHQLTWCPLRDLGTGSRRNCPVSGVLFPATISPWVLFPRSHIHKPKRMIRKVKRPTENTEVRTRPPLPEVFIPPRSEESTKKRESWKQVAGIVLLAEILFVTLFSRISNCRHTIHQVCLHTYISCSRRSMVYMCAAPTGLANSNDKKAQQMLFDLSQQETM